MGSFFWSCQFGLLLKTQNLVVGPPWLNGSHLLKQMQVHSGPLYSPYCHPDPEAIICQLPFIITLSISFFF